MSLNELRAEFWIDRITRAVTALEKIGAALEERCAGGNDSPRKSGSCSSESSGSSSSSSSTVATPAASSPSEASQSDPAALVREIFSQDAMPQLISWQYARDLALRCVARATDEIVKELREVHRLMSQGGHFYDVDRARGKLAGLIAAIGEKGTA